MVRDASIGAIILILIALPHLASAFETSVLNNSCGDYSIYRSIDVNFDSTHNIYYVYTNRSVNISFEQSPNMFHIWNLYVEKDGKPYLFDPRPSLTPHEDNTFSFNYLVSNSDGFHFYKIEFNREDVKQFWPDWLYPFDQYKLIEMQNISEGMGTISEYKFPNVDIAISSTYDVYGGNATLTHEGIGKNLTFHYGERVIIANNTVYTSYICLLNNKIVGINIHLFYPIFNTYVEDPQELEVSGNIPEEHAITISRSPFPSQILFFILVILVGFIAYYNKKINTADRWKQFYETYAQSLLPIILAEYTVIAIPPSRPLMPTLFDAIILLPLLILLDAAENVIAGGVIAAIGFLLMSSDVSRAIIGLSLILPGFAAYLNYRSWKKWFGGLTVFAGFIIGTGMTLRFVTSNLFNLLGFIFALVGGILIIIEG